MSPMTARNIYDTAQIILSSKGTPLPILELDPFTSASVKYIDDKVCMLWVKQLGVLPSGAVTDTSRVVISKGRGDPWAAFEEPSTRIEHTPDTWFDYVESPSGAGDALLYVPGPWIKHLMDLRESIPGWANPKRLRK